MSFLIGKLFALGPYLTFTNLFTCFFLTVVISGIYPVIWLRVMRTLDKLDDDPSMLKWIVAISAILFLWGNLLLHNLIEEALELD